jgi:uncharacterized membrane protein
MDGLVTERVDAPVANDSREPVVVERDRAIDATKTPSPVPAGSPGGSTTVGVDRVLHRIGRAGWILIGVQLVAMLVLSSWAYQRYALSVGFGTYTQAWVAIAHGHLDPMSTLIGKPFWRNDAEFIVWPLSLLYHLYPHPIDLLWVQDIAVALTEAVAFGWVLEVIRGGSGARHEALGPWLAVGALAVILVEPFSYMTIAYDVHTEVFAALFVVLAGRALWAARFRQLWWWVPLALMTDAFAGLYVVAVGISGVVAGRRTRRSGLVLVGVGMAWILLISAVGGNEFGYAHSLSGWYGYLVGHRAGVSPFGVVVGVLSHPVTAAHMVLTRWNLIFDFCVVMGLIGLASPWAWPMACVVIIPSALNANVAFLEPHASFQTWPTLPFVLVGSVMVLQRLALGTARARRVAGAVGVLWLIALVVVAGALLPGVSGFWITVAPKPAAQLARLDSEIPPRAEVIASWGVVGRFAVRSDVYAYGPLSRTFPVSRPDVVFVLSPGEGIYEVTPSTARAAVRFVERQLGAKVVVARDDVYGLEWRPPPGTARVTLP